MKLIALVLGLLLTSSAFGAAGFTAGEEFKANHVEGVLDLTCYGPGQTRRVSWICYDNYLTPAMYTRFYTDSGVDADRVKITATNEKGKSRSKSSGFKSSKGESSSSFNLWINTLLQRALLSYGDNVISYTLEKDGQEVESGEFDVTVTQEPKRYCQRAWATSHNMNDCVNGNYICGVYLRNYAHTCR